MLPLTTNQQPSPMRTLSPPLQILSTTVQSSYRLHQHFPWHGTSFPRSTIHIHVNVARHPSHSSLPPLAQAFSRVRAEVAFQSTASVVPSGVWKEEVGEGGREGCGGGRRPSELWNIFCRGNNLNQETCLTFLDSCPGVC